jgi:hypothetical protein
MKDNKKEMAILNLTGMLSPALEEYFEIRKIKVIDPLVKFEDLEWSHILTKDIIDFNLLGSTYKTREKDVKVVSLSRVLDLQNFMLNNGKLVLDEVWMKNSIGTFILDKFFHEYTSMSLAESYPEFEEKGSFNVINPFSTGEYLDQMTHHAFEANVPALSIKTFFDHLIMYLASLKKRDKAGLPFEVTYGHFDGVFGVQVSLLTKRLIMEDVHSSLSSHISKQSEQYFLNISVQSADFFDFTYLPEVTKTVITGLWTNDERIKFENRGMLFSHQAVAGPLALMNTDAAANPMLMQDGSLSIQDHTEEIISSVQEDFPETARFKGQEFGESLSEKISSTMEVDKIKQIISGTEDENAHAEMVRGQKVGDDIISLVKGNIDENKGIFRVSGGQFDADNFTQTVIAGVEDKWKKDSPFMLKRLEQLPETLKTGLFDFAKRMNKELEDFTDEDIDIFKEYEVPKLLNPKSEDGLNFRPDLEHFLKEEFQVDNLASIVEMLDNPEDLIRIRAALKSSLHKSLDDKFHISDKTELSNREKEVLVKSLTSSLEEEEQKIREIVEFEKDKHIEAAPLFSAEPGTQLVEVNQLLEQQNRSLKAENEQVKFHLDKLVSEVKILKESRKQLEDMNHSARSEAAYAVLAEDIVDDPFKKKIEAHRELVKDDYSKITQLIDKEAENKRLHIEMEKKEMFFLQELEKVQRQLRAKDTAMVKAKDALGKLSHRRESEVKELKSKLELTTRAMMNGPSQGQATHIKMLEKQNASMTKMIEIYKEKISNLVAKIESSRSGEGSSKDELRKLVIQNGQYKNLLDTSKRELQKLQEKSAADSAQVNTLKKEKSTLEQALKKASSAQLEKIPSTMVVDTDGQRLLEKNENLETQIRDLTLKLRDTETKLLEAQRTQKPQVSVDDQAKGKLGQMENTVKKLTQDLAERSYQLNEMKKDVNKLRQEKTAVQNQLDRTRKELEKANSKAASPKGGGKAA